MGSNRNKFRSSSLGVQQQFRKVLIPLRDATQSARLEDVIGPDGKPVLEPELDAKGKPALDEAGLPKMKVKQALKRPPKIDDDGKPMMMEVREPSVKTRATILKRGGAQLGDPNKLELDSMSIECALHLVFVPGTEEHIFEEADRAVLLSLPVGSFLDDITEAALPLLNVDTGASEKNSAGTPGSSSSSR